MLEAHTRTYAFERYIPRSLLNTLGPCLLTVFYLLILFVYILRSSENGVIPYYPIDARTVFYGWLILSVFVLDWAKSGIAGFEAAALMKPALAPRDGLQLMWHNDRAWGSISGWWNALSSLYTDLKYLFSKKQESHLSKGPGLLWWYLALSSFLLYVATPLAGLSMDPALSLKTSNRQIRIVGPNETFFDSATANAISETANSRWRQGNPTTPEGDTILYAPQGSYNVSGTYFNDAVKDIYSTDMSGTSSANNRISFFSGPQVSETAHGKAWGLFTNLSCSIVDPYHGLKLINMTSISNWSVPIASLTSTSYAFAANSSIGPHFSSGLNPGTFYEGDTSFGVNYKYLIASDGAIEGGSDYTNASSLPNNGTLELVMWQHYDLPFVPDQTFMNMSSHPFVVSSTWPTGNDANKTYLGYALSCSANSTTGYARFSASTRTFSHFVPLPATSFSEQISLGDIPIFAQPGILGLHSTVYSAFTTAILKFGAPLACEIGSSATCNPWYGANSATGGRPYLVQNPTNPRTKNLQYPTISPERMKLAILKLFGEASIAMMASGSGTGVWKTPNITGLDTANDIVPGTIPWQIIVALLSIWMLITVLPNLLPWAFSGRRWAGILDGFAMFRLGAEWQREVWKFGDRSFMGNENLRTVPGLVGDMQPENRERGFVGLSRYPVGSLSKGHDHLGRGRNSRGGKMMREWAYDRRKGHTEADDDDGDGDEKKGIHRVEPSMTGYTIVATNTTN